jgi:hypothetical protein
LNDDLDEPRRMTPSQRPIVLIEAPPGRREKIISTCLIISSVAAFALMAPAARVPLPKITAFIPAYEAALSISDLLTSVLLFGQFARSGLKSLLVLACAYLFDVFIIVPHALSFPGVFGTAGVIGGGVQTTAWLYCFWHAGFALLVLIYALLANLDGRTTRVRNIRDRRRANWRGCYRAHPSGYRRSRSPNSDHDPRGLLDAGVEGYQPGYLYC